MISSRTPEGWPGRCPVCEQDVTVEPADALSDAPCPACGTLLWPIVHDGATHLMGGETFPRDRRAAILEVARLLEDGDSMDWVDALESIEAAFGVHVEIEDVEQWRTAQEFLDWVERLK